MADKSSPTLNLISDTWMPQ